MTNFMPNVNTEAKQKRLMDLVREQDNKQYAIVQFVNENEQDIFSALKEAVKRGLVDDNYDEDDDGKSIDLADAFMRVLRELLYIGTRRCTTRRCQTNAYRSRGRSHLRWVRTPRISSSLLQGSTDFSENTLGTFR